jgi:stage V sporulation protein B
MTKTQKSFLGGAAILAGAGLVVKIIGAIFRIPLTNIVGAEGMGLYQLAYPIYVFLLVASTAGLPVAVSRMVSAEIALGNHREAHKIFTTAMKLLIGLGLVTGIAMFAGSGLISRLQGNPDSVGVLRAIAPALFFVSVISAYRGYFQGMQSMAPTAFSQLVEQVGKLAIGLSLAAAWIPRGPQYGAVGAILGVTLSEVAALVLLMGIYMGRRREIMARVNASTDSETKSTKTILIKIIEIAVPVTIGASVMPLVNFADQMIVLNRIKPIIDQIAGIPASVMLEKTGTEIATSLYGILTGACNTLVNFPAFITLALGMSLVPAISAATVKNDRKEVARTASVGVRLTLLLGLPCAAGLIVLAEPIIRVLYSSFPDWQAIYGGWVLSLLAVGVIFLTLIQSMTAILQGAGKVMLPVRNLLIGAVFKVVITYVLSGQPGWNIRGAAMGTVICYAIAAILNLIGVIRHTGVAFSLRDFILKPVAAAGVMGLVVWGVRAFIFARTGSWGMTLVLAMIAGVAVYGIMLFVVRAMTKEDIDMVPGLNKIAKRFRKGRQG